MYVLVDYDNVDQLIREKGAKYTIERIASKLCARVPAIPRRVNFRLYGGWYDLTSMTRYAEKISLELSADFPRTFRPFTSSISQETLVLQAELARALLVDPDNNLLHTFRERETPKGFKVNSPQSAGCSKADCGLRHLKDFIKKGYCPAAGCILTSRDLLIKAEQKLVDVMLASDLLHIVDTKPDELIAVVSSDEDLWPALRQALLKTQNVIHVQAVPNRRTPAHYSNLLGTTYIEIDI